MLKSPPATYYLWGFHVLRVALGICLLTTAGLKAHTLAFGDLGPESVLTSLRLQLVTFEIEALLGLWLLSGWSMHAARMTALAFFGILASASLYLALVGQTSCGCLGQVVSVSPWTTFTFDLSAIAALTLLRPPPGQATNRDSEAWVPELLKAGGVAAVLLAFLSGALLLAYTNPAEGLARLRGESIPESFDHAVEELINHESLILEGTSLSACCVSD